MRTIFIAVGNIGMALAFESPSDAEQYVESVAKAWNLPVPKIVEVPIVPAGPIVSMSDAGGFMETVRRVPLSQVEEVCL